MIDSYLLGDFFRKVSSLAKIYHQDFNQLDGQLGDGDLGITISKGINEIVDNIKDFDKDLGKTFLICSKSFTKASSSSFGTLIAVSFLTLAKNLKGFEQIDIKQLVPILEKVLESILSRGKSNIGDKTFADSLHEIIINLKNCQANDNYGLIIYEASNQALEKFKNKRCNIGRARMFEEKSMKLNDPGMSAINKLCEVFR